jgi:hypothetical protein
VEEVSYPEERGRSMSRRESKLGFSEENVRAKPGEHLYPHLEAPN